MKRLYVDVTESTVLIKCNDCPWWHALRFTREEAWRAGRDHETNVHPGSKQATAVLAHYEIRHAGDRES